MEEIDLDSNINTLQNIYASQGELNLKDYSNEIQNINNSPYLQVQLESEKIITIKKSSLCWLMQQDKTKLSNDRNIRVRGVKNKSKTDNISTALKEKHIKTGNWCVFNDSKNTFLLGQVLGFFIEEMGTTKSETKSLNIEICDISNKKILCLGTWYRLKKDFSLEIAEQQALLKLTFYKITIPEPIWYQDTCKIDEKIAKIIYENVNNARDKNNIRKEKTKNVVKNSNKKFSSTSSSADTDSTEDDDEDEVSLHDSSSDQLESDVDLNTIEEKNKLNIQLEKYYGVFYDINWYIGRIIEENADDHTFKVKFLMKSLDDLVWPKHQDVQWVKKDFFIYGPIKLLGNDPFQLRRTDLVEIEKRFKEMKKLKM